MSYVIKIEWLGDMDRKEPSEHEGRYVSRYDINAHDGRGQVWTTDNPREAIHFMTPVRAMRFYQRVSTVKPTREDGKPNRPLTAFTVSVFDWEKP